jgi:hypothetical protein
MALRTGLDECKNSRRNDIRSPDRLASYRVAIPTTLSGPTQNISTWRQMSYISLILFMFYVFFSLKYSSVHS